MEHQQTLMFARCGAPEEVVELRPQDRPTPGPGQVLVRMLAAPVNPSDLLYIRGVYGIRPVLPARPGFEGAGIVEASGGGLLGKFYEGRRVAVISASGGTWGSYCLADAKAVMPVPKSLNDEAAATFFINPATALLMTRWILQAPKGKWLMQSAAGSAVGRMVIRLGNRFGFRTLNLVRRADQGAELIELGGDAVLAVDDDTSAEDFQRKVRNIAGNAMPFAALDAVGGQIGSLMAGALGDRGRMIVYGSLSESAIAVSPRDLIVNDLKLESFWLGRAMQALSLPRKLKLIRELSRLHQSGAFDVVEFDTFKLNNSAAALAHAKDRPGGRKTLFQIS